MYVCNEGIWCKKHRSLCNSAINPKYIYMKKTVFFLLTCLCATILSAQTSFYAEDLNSTYAETAIVRSWDNGEAAITYYETGGAYYVQYVNYLTGVSYRSEVPDYLHILDMYILGDTVFYCGYYGLNIGWSGVVGYFKPNDFYSGTGNIKFRVLSVPPLTIVSKLVVQGNGTGGHEVVAIGEHKWYDTVVDEQGHLIQLIPHLNRHFLFCRNIRQLNVTYDTILVPPEERYYDVLLTENRIVFVGVAYYLSYNMICLRAMDRTNAYPLPSFTQLDNIYAFPTGRDEVFSAMHSTATNKDSIATAYMHINTDGMVTSNRIRVFDVVQMTNDYSQEYIVPEKSEARDIIYIPADNSLVCMHDFNTPSGLFNTNFVYLDPIATSNYLAYIEYIKNTFFWSLTNRLDTFYLGSLGQTWFMKDKINVGSYPNNYCPQKEKMECIFLENIEGINTLLGMFHRDNTERRILINKALNLRHVGVVCNNP